MRNELEELYIQRKGEGKEKGRENIEKTPENSPKGNGNPHNSQKGNLKHLKTFRKEIAHNRHTAPRARTFDRAHASEKVELLLIQQLYTK